MLALTGCGGDTSNGTAGSGETQALGETQVQGELLAAVGTGPVVSSMHSA